MKGMRVSLRYIRKDTFASTRKYLWWFMSRMLTSHQTSILKRDEAADPPNGHRVCLTVRIGRCDYGRNDRQPRCTPCDRWTSGMWSTTFLGLRLVLPFSHPWQEMVGSSYGIWPARPWIRSSLRMPTRLGATSELMWCTGI